MLFVISGRTVYDKNKSICRVWNFGAFILTHVGLYPGWKKWHTTTVSKMKYLLFICRIALIEGLHEAYYYVILSRNLWLKMTYVSLYGIKHMSF